MDQLARMFAPFFHPDLTLSYILALLPPMLSTLGLALGAMTLAFLLSIPFATLIAIRVPGWRLFSTLLAVVRAIPDLTMAILCVILFGIGTGAAVVALAIYYTATVTRVFANLIETAPERPVEALRATGASALQTACFAQLPLSRDDLLSYGAFAFECCLRSAVIVGAVGGGGIGAELIGSLAGFDFQHASTQIILLVVVIIGLDHAATWLRRHHRLLGLLVPFGLVAAWYYGPDFIAPSHAIETLGEMFPPKLDAAALAALPGLIGQTLAIAFSSTLAAALLAVAAGLAASHSLSPLLIRVAVRRLLDLFRAIPEVVWGLVLVAVAGVGPVAGALALGLHSFGSLGRVFADAIDDVPERPRQAIAATGASSLVVAFYASLPLARNVMATHVLARLEWNLRMATVLGMIGAGGVGQALYEAQQLFFYPQVVSYVLVTAVLVLTADHLGGALRRRLRVPRGRMMVAGVPDDGALAV
jgi:phosphonate transport system permease protein